MAFEASGPALAAFLFALARSAGWVLVAPPFSSRAVPSTVRAAVALALALPVAPRLVERAGGQVPDTWGLVTGVVVQTSVGALLGFVTYLLFAVVQAAGDLLDLFGGFSLASAFDPLSLSTNSVFGRLHQLLATVLLFAVDGHLVVVHGFLTSYDALAGSPATWQPTGQLPAAGAVGRLLVHDVGVFFTSALQLAGPMLGVLFLADVALGLLTRVAPALNAFSLSFPLKILVTLTLVGTTFVLLPGAIRHLTDLAVRSMLAVARS